MGPPSKRGVTTHAEATRRSFKPATVILRRPPKKPRSGSPSRRSPGEQHIPSVDRKRRSDAVRRAPVGSSGSMLPCAVRPHLQPFHSTALNKAEDTIEPQSASSDLAIREPAAFCGHCGEARLPARGPDRAMIDPATVQRHGAPYKSLAKRETFDGVGGPSFPYLRERPALKRRPRFFGLPSHQTPLEPLFVWRPHLDEQVLARFCPRLPAGNSASVALFPDWELLATRTLPRTDASSIGWRRPRARALAADLKPGIPMPSTGHQQARSWCSLRNFLQPQTHHRGQVHCM